MAASTTDSKLLKWPVQRRIHYVDELLVEFSGELSGHIHVACIPPSPPPFLCSLYTLEHLHGGKIIKMIGFIFLFCYCLIFICSCRSRVICDKNCLRMLYSKQK